LHFPGIEEGSDHPLCHAFKDDQTVDGVP
jgi:hypothetical protein